MVTMKLHNLCLDRNVDIPNHRHNEDMQARDKHVVFDNNDEEEDGQLRARATGERRNYLTQKLQDEGRGRPQHASCNSRQ